MSNLQEDLDMANGCLNMIRDELIRLGCRCGSDAHKCTPPMMYPEWINCVMIHHMETMQEEIDDLKAQLDTVCKERDASIEQMDEFVGELTEANAKIAELEAEIRKANNAMDRDYREKKELLTRLNSARKRLIAWDKNTKKLMEERNRYRKALQKLSEWREGSWEYVEGVGWDRPTFSDDEQWDLAESIAQEALETRE